MVTNPDSDRLIKLIKEIESLKKLPSSGYPTFKVWKSNVQRILLKLFGNDIHLEQFSGIKFYPATLFGSETRRTEMKKNRLVNGLNEASALLTEFISEIPVLDTQNTDSGKTKLDNKKVFLVHGHDEKMLLKVKDFVGSLDLNPIILHEKADEGDTVIEKFERHSDVGFAVILLSPDDIGYTVNKEDEKRPRARQNVILEMGYYLAKLTRKGVRALYVEGVEIPSDYNGVLFIKFEGEDWKLKLAREMKASGLDVDLNKLV